VFSFDPEWLAIVRAFNPFLSRKRAQIPFPDEATARASVTRELAWVQEHIVGPDGGERLVNDVQKFEMTAPGGPGGPQHGHRELGFLARHGLHLPRFPISAFLQQPAN
jgi:hypothetical protein